MDAGLWAWRANIGMKIINKMPHYEFSFDGVNSFDVSKLGRHQNLMPPYCFMHFGWADEEKVRRQLEYYKTSGLIPNVAHPLNYGGRVEPLMDWMIE